MSFAVNPYCTCGCKSVYSASKPVSLDKDYDKDYDFDRDLDKDFDCDYDLDLDLDKPMNFVA